MKLYTYFLIRFFIALGVSLALFAGLLMLLSLSCWGGRTTPEIEEFKCNPIRSCTVYEYDGLTKVLYWQMLNCLYERDKDWEMCVQLHKKAIEGINK